MESLHDGILRRWRRFWLGRAGPGSAGRWACRMAGLGTGPYYARHVLARMSPRGYFDYRAQIHHPLLDTGEHVFVDEDVLIFQDRNGGPVELGRNVHIHRGSVLQTGQGGRLRLGRETSAQVRCHFAAYVGDIIIGDAVQIAPNCAFFSYNHGTSDGSRILSQPLYSHGGIEVGDDAWLGAGCTILDGARIGTGAIIAAGAVITGVIPSGAIAAGVPARVLRYREGAQEFCDSRAQGA